MKRALTTIALLLLAASARADDRPPVKTAAHVDLPRYLGTWYEIASFPQWFQRNCHGTTATYSLRDDGDIEVQNRCRKGSLDGKESGAKGKAWVVDKATNAKLKVQFVWPFRADYWILDVDPDYQWALVGDPSRKYLWILSRTPQMAPAVYESLLEKLRAQQFDLSRLQKTEQPGAAG